MFCAVLRVLYNFDVPEFLYTFFSILYALLLSIDHIVGPWKYHIYSQTNKNFTIKKGNGKLSKYKIDFVCSISRDN